MNKFDELEAEYKRTVPFYKRFYKFYIKFPLNLKNSVDEWVKIVAYMKDIYLTADNLDRAKEALKLLKENKIEYKGNLDDKITELNREIDDCNNIIEPRIKELKEIYGLS